MSTLLVEIDGSDVTNDALSGSWTPRLNRPAQAQVTLPMESSPGDVGSRLKITINGSLVFHGFILNLETDTNKDGGTSVYNAQDPMELWQWRPVRDDDGDFSKPDIIVTYDTGPQILEAMLTNTVSAGAGPPTDAEGAIFLDMGTFAAGGPSLAGAPTDWPMTIAQLTSLLMSTGQLDAVITATDPGGGVMGTIDAYNGDYGTDLSGSVVFSYGTGAHNVDSLRWNRDITNVVNKYWLYGGPRIGTAADPAGDQHWCFNVTGGVACVTGKSGYASVITKRTASQSAYGVRMKIDIFDAYDGCAGVATVGHELYCNQWIEYSFIAAGPREIIHVTPTRDAEIGTFGIGDLVGLEAVADVAGGYSGLVQRVYGYTISWDEDSVLTLGEIQTSADAEF